jgi:hypothetical protein
MSQTCDFPMATGFVNIDAKLGVCGLGETSNGKGNRVLHSERFPPERKVGCALKPRSDHRVCTAPKEIRLINKACWGAP